MAEGGVCVSSGIFETNVIVAPNSPILRAKERITPAMMLSGEAPLGIVYQTDAVANKASGRLLLRGAAVDTQDFAYLWPLGPRTGADLERRARRYAVVAAALDHTHMQEGIAGPTGKLYEAESLVGVVPFDYGLDRGTGGCFEPLGAKPQ